MYYNTKLKENWFGELVEIFENEEICEGCNGFGKKTIFNEYVYTHQRCQKCGGHGKVNWLQKVFN